MPTEGLKGIWGLEQLDRTGIATWKLGVLLVGGFSLVGVLIALFLDYLDPVHPELLLLGSLGTLILFFISGLGLFITLALSRATESDLHQLTVIDSSMEDAIRLLRPQMHILLPSMVFGIIFFGTLFLVANMIITERSVLEIFTALNSGGIQEIVIEYVFIPLFGIVGGVALATYLKQVQSLTYAAHRLKIDLFQLSQYSNIANPLVRFIVVSLLFLTIVPLITLVDPAFGRGALLVTFLLVALAISVALLYAYPVLLLRNRIKDKKEKELNALLQSLQGDDEAIKTLSLQSRGVPTSTQDFLIHQMFVNSLWEWPIAPHVKKIALFGLLPPSTWVLAAGVENLLY